MEEHRPEVQNAPSPAAEDTDPRPANRARSVTIAVLVAAAAVVAAIVLLVNTGQETDPTVAPESWQQPDLEGAKAIELREGDGHEAVVVISADEETCWSGYIAEEAVEGCGRSSYLVENAPGVLGVNASSKEPEKFFLGVAAWDGAGERMIGSARTKRKFGTVALSAPLTGGT